MTPGNLAALGRTYRALNLNVKLLGKEREMKELVSKIEHQRPMLNSHSFEVILVNMDMLATEYLTGREII